MFVRGRASEAPVGERIWSLLYEEFPIEPSGILPEYHPEVSPHTLPQKTCEFVPEIYIKIAKTDGRTSRSSLEIFVYQYTVSTALALSAKCS